MDLALEEVAAGGRECVAVTLAEARERVLQLFRDRLQSAPA